VSLEGVRRGTYGEEEGKVWVVLSTVEFGNEVGVPSVDFDRSLFDKVCDNVGGGCESLTVRLKGRKSAMWVLATKNWTYRTRIRYGILTILRKEGIKFSPFPRLTVLVSTWSSPYPSSRLLKGRGERNTREQ